MSKLFRHAEKCSTQIIKTGSSKAEHTNNNLYRYSKIYVNIKYSLSFTVNYQAFS